LRSEAAASYAVPVSQGKANKAYRYGLSKGKMGEKFQECPEGDEHIVRYATHPTPV
jgi:hypothetical protein